MRAERVRSLQCIRHRSQRDAEQEMLSSGLHIRALSERRREPFFPFRAFSFIYFYIYF